MCGIAGCVFKDRNDNVKEILGKMADAAKWRGPDGRGIIIDSVSDVTVGFAHRRLSVIDLSQNGSQPMKSEDGHYCITYNGEIYNYKLLRKDLERRGYVFHSDCDTEVVLKSCIEYGVDQAVQKFNGMWAFAFYDKKRGKIFLSRDRMGVKPLYYLNYAGVFSFASDLISLYELPDFDMTMDFRSLHGYLWNMYVPAPYTIFKGVKKLIPGSILEYDVQKGKESIKSWWDVNSLKSEFQGSYEEYKEEIEIILEDAVKARLEADVPVGVFLSGGIDSSFIASLAQKNSGKSIKTYSIGFYEKKDDDAKVALEVANILGTQHHELYCTQKEAIELIKDIPDAYAEPFADNSQIPTMLLSRMTKEHVTVALSGDGGDELFLGYPSYISRCQLFEKRKRLKVLNPFLEAASGVLGNYNHKKWLIDKYYNASDFTKGLNLDYATARSFIDSILPNFYQDAELFDLFGGYGYQKANLSFVRAMDLQSIKYGLADDMLVKVDRASMFYSLECRCPILDYRVVECALSAPIEYNIHEGVLKAPLKDLLNKYVSKEIIERPKSGFGVPINKWLHGDLLELVNDNISESVIVQQGIFDINGIRRFQKEFNRQRNPILDRIAYTLLMFQLWWKRYCNVR